MSDNIWYLKDFPFTTTFTTPGTLNPIAVPLTTCVEWWYRIRNWAVSTDFTVTDSSVPPQIFTVPNGIMNPAGYTRELDMINDAGLLTFVIFPGVFDPGVQMWMFDTTTPNDPLINNSGTYYPWISVFGQCQIRFNSNAALGFPNSTPGTIAGIPITIYYENPLAGSTVTVSFFDFTPVEWWPYASRFDGSPIWDTATGAQLQDLTN